MTKRYMAMTLAEVLITIGIIGVIGVMTVPSLVQDFREKTTVVTLKKTYSTLSQAYTLAVAENGTPDNWDLITYYDSQGALNMLAKFIPYLKITKNCGTGQGCFPALPYPALHTTTTQVRNLNDDTGISKVQLSDGVSIAFIVYNPICADPRGNSQALQNNCGLIYIDTNGLKNPNIIGKDLFVVYITKYGLIPFGSTLESGSSYPFSTECLDHHGWGCAAWVLYNENMDYLHCNDLAWDGKTKCD